MATLKWGGETLVNTRTAGDQRNSDVAALASGGYVVTWQDGSGPGKSFIRFQQFDADGNKAGRETAVVGSTGNTYKNPAITALADGGFWIAYTHDVLTDNYIEGSVYNSKGVFVREQVSVFANGHDDYVDVTKAGKRSAAAWYDPDGRNIILRVFDEKGVGSDLKTVNDRVAVNAQVTSIASNPGGSRLAVAWDNTAAGSKGHFIGVFDALGKSTSNLSFLSGTINEPQVTWLNGDQFVVAWTQIESNGLGHQVKARIYTEISSSLGLKTSDIIVVNGISAGTQGEPAVAALPNGGFAVAWEDDSQIGSDNGGSAILLQAFDGSGSKVGSEIFVTTTTSQDQSHPKIAALADGRVVVTWTDESHSEDDPAGDAVRSQIIDPRDGIVAGSDRPDTLRGHESVGDELSGGRGSDTMLGLGGNDSIYGGAGNDTADGGRGDDTIRGGTGLDRLTGGRGNDAFVFDTALSVKTNVDRIVDFARGQDEIQLDNAIFKAFAAGDLAAAAFKDLGASGAKLDADDRIVYNRKTGDLFYDPDGSGKAAAVLFAHLDNKAMLAAADFLVV